MAFAPTAALDLVRPPSRPDLSTLCTNEIAPRASTHHGAESMRGIIIPSCSSGHRESKRDRCGPTQRQRKQVISWTLKTNLPVRREIILPCAVAISEAHHLMFPAVTSNTPTKSLQSAHPNVDSYCVCVCVCPTMNPNRGIS